MAQFYSRSSRAALAVILLISALAGSRMPVGADPVYTELVNVDSVGVLPSSVFTGDPSRISEIKHDEPQLVGQGQSWDGSATELELTEEMQREIFTEGRQREENRGEIQFTEGRQREENRAVRWRDNAKPRDGGYGKKQKEPTKLNAGQGVKAGKLPTDVLNGLKEKKGVKQSTEDAFHGFKEKKAAKLQFTEDASNGPKDKKMRIQNSDDVLKGLREKFGDGSHGKEKKVGKLSDASHGKVKDVNGKDEIFGDSYSSHGLKLGGASHGLKEKLGGASHGLKLGDSQGLKDKLATKKAAKDESKVHFSEDAQSKVHSAGNADTPEILDAYGVNPDVSVSDDSRSKKSDIFWKLQQKKAEKEDVKILKGDNKNTEGLNLKVRSKKSERKEGKPEKFSLQQRKGEKSEKLTLEQQHGLEPLEEYELQQSDASTRRLVGIDPSVLMRGSRGSEEYRKKNAGTDASRNRRKTETDNIVQKAKRLVSGLGKDKDARRGWRKGKNDHE